MPGNPTFWLPDQPRSNGLPLGQMQTLTEHATVLAPALGGRLCSWFHLADDTLVGSTRDTVVGVDRRDTGLGAPGGSGLTPLPTQAHL
jgi:hypothetical protein